VNQDKPGVKAFAVRPGQLEVLNHVFRLSGGIDFRFDLRENCF
jgi:hypothetical protein